jgi:type IV secretion system protein VirB1
MDPATFLTLALACAPRVDSGTAAALVRVESGFNAHAIGVVEGALDRQPRNRAEARATARKLQADGWNFSVGLAQINARNFARLGLTSETAFDPCANLAAMQSLLQDCFDRASSRGDLAQHAVRKALSCYYSGNFVTGFRDGYVGRVVSAARSMAERPPSTLRHPKETS